jgi:Bifunctional DNA primase/polymerase, N-terminal
MPTDHTKRRPQVRVDEKLVSLGGLSRIGIYALRCARQGYFVIPMHSMSEGGCTCSSWQKSHGRCKPAKHPITRHGYNDATNDPLKVRKWWRKWPWANVGLATGPSGLLALDPDSRHGGDKVLEELKATYGPLPFTWAVKSGSGDTRFIFRLPKGVTFRSGIIQTASGKLDVLAETNGLIVAGIHYSGNPYIGRLEEPAELPEPWIKGLTQYLSPHTPYKVPRYVRGAGEREDSKIDSVVLSLDQADPKSLMAAHFIWLKLRPDEPFPDEGQLVRCLLHPDEQHPSGGFLVVRQRVKFHCFHEQKSYAPVDLYMRLMLKFNLPDEGRLPDYLLALFDARLMIEAKAIDRPEVPYDPLPPEAPEDERRLYEAFLDLVAAKWVRYPGKPTGFSYAFASVWAGMPWEKVGNVWKRLLKRGVVTPAGQGEVTKYGKPLTLFLPTRALLALQLVTANVASEETSLAMWEREAA